MIKQIVLLLILIAAVWVHGNYHGKSTERLQWQQEREQAVNQARETERAMQERANDAIQKQFDDLAAVHGQLIADLDGLRNRPERSEMSRNPRPECQGADGRELSRTDAAFLTRLAARAEEIRIALIGCYAYADSLKR